MEQFRQVREGMRIDFNVPITARDGLVLRANIYHPMEEGVYPVIFNYGIYGKDFHLQDKNPDGYARVFQNVPEFFVGTSGLHHTHELVDPEKWCQWGYVIARVDSRGAGQSPGYMSPYCQEEANDMYDCVEWFAAQPWCNGKVGITGTSYHAIGMWDCAALQPPHLAGFVAWEGHSDIYRDCMRHGGILTNFFPSWYKSSPMQTQYGRGERGFHSRVTGLPVSGDVTMTDDELRANRIDYGAVIADKANELPSDFHKSAMPDLSKITAPFLTVMDWTGQGVHSRGTLNGYIESSSKEKYLYTVIGPHGHLFYGDFGVNLQKKFFGHYLKGEGSMKDMPKIRLRLPKVGEGSFEYKESAYRNENEFPLARTKYTKYYLDFENYGLTTKEPTGTGKITYKGMSSDGITFMSQPLEEEMEFTGYIMSKLFISSDTTDADLFLVVRIFAPDMKEITFDGANANNVPCAVGWQRASHRKLDPKKSKPYRPFLAHDEIQPLKPGEVVEMNVEIWPMSFTVPKDYRIGLSIRGKDYVYPGYKPLPYEIPKFDDGADRNDGVGITCHRDPIDRPAKIYDGNVTVHFDKDKRPYLMLPIIPPK